MAEIVLTLGNKVGLHARPAGAFVRVAKEFKSDIRVTHGDKQANGKSILSILSLGAEHGSVVKIAAAGDDATQALEALKQLAENNFGEKE
jgi:phosphotransferase system HPr (HPr) family protein